MLNDGTANLPVTRHHVI